MASLLKSMQAVETKVMVPKKGLEPPHPYGYMDLNHARLPIPPLRQKVTLGYAAHSGADLSGRGTINILPGRRKLSNLRRAIPQSQLMSVCLLRLRLSFQLRAQSNVRFQHLGHRTVRFRALSNLLECRIVGSGHVSHGVKMNPRNGPPP